MNPIIHEIFTIARAGGAESDLKQLGTFSGVLWGVAPTGVMHIGYLPYILILRILESQGVRTKVVLADYHAYLDSEKSSWSQLASRTVLYHRMFEAAGLSQVVNTANFYREPRYFDEFVKLSRLVPVSEALAAGRTTIAKQEENLAEVLYVALQVLDVRYLSCDLVMCGFDEADIYRFGLPILERSYGIPCGSLYLPTCPGLFQPEMHSSDDSSNKITLLAPRDEILEKLRCYRDRHGAKGALLSYLRAIVLPLTRLLRKVSGDEAVRLSENSSVEMIAEVLDSLIEPIRRVQGTFSVDSPGTQQPHELVQGGAHVVAR